MIRAFQVAMSPAKSSSRSPIDGHNFCCPRHFRRLSIWDHFQKNVTLWTQFRLGEHRQTNTTTTQ